MVIRANKQIKHGITCMCSHPFYKLINKGGNSSIMDGDGIEGLEIMHNLKGAVLLFDTEPARAV